MATKEQHFGADEVRQRLTENRPGKLDRALRSVGGFIRHHPAETSLISTVLISGGAYDTLNDHVLLRALGILPGIIITDTLTPDLQTNIAAHQAEFTTDTDPTDPIVIAAPTANKTPTSAAAITAIPEATATSAPTTAPTEVPATPTPKLGYESTDQGLIYRSEKNEILNVPQIEGLKAEMITTDDSKQKVEYKALESNKYGLEAGGYAGEYISNVKMALEEGKEKQTGGLALTSPVVRQLINEKLAAVPNQRDKWIIVLPVDIRTTMEGKYVTISTEIGRAMGSKMLRINYVGETPVVNIILNGNKLSIADSAYYGTSYYHPMRDLDVNADLIILGREMDYIGVATDLQGVGSTVTKLESSFGDKVGTSVKPVIVNIGAASERRNITSDKILSVNNTPVFLAANGSTNKANQGFKTLADGSIDYGKGVIGPSLADQNT